MRCWQRCEAGGRSWRDETAPYPNLPPRCPHCGGLLRPGVVWFGEGLDPADVIAAADAARCDVFLTIGTSSVVYPAAGLVHQAKRHGALTIEINTEATGASERGRHLDSRKAEEVLVEIERHL